MKKHDALSVGQIINQAMSATGHADEVDRQHACYLWQEVVGPAVNKYTTRRWVDRDTLHVCISSAPLRNELLYHTDSIISNLNRLLGKPLLTRLILH